MKRTSEIQNLPWKLIQQWEANNEVRSLHKYAIKAAHKPKNAISNEKVIIFVGNDKIVREKIGTRWSEPYYA
jgi:hypothetical protein